MELLRVLFVWDGRLADHAKGEDTQGERERDPECESVARLAM